MVKSPSRRGAARSVSASMVVHALVITAALSYAINHRGAVIHPRGIHSGTKHDIIYLPGRMPAFTLHPAAKVQPPAVAKLKPSSLPAPPALPAPLLPHVTLTPEAPGENNSSSPSDVPDRTAGLNSWGSGDAQQIALTTYSPSPAPDLSPLPRGAQGDVIVDVTIDSDGRVSDLTVVKTLGYGIESTVVNTVRTWTFRPATKDGVTVASLQELLFHFAKPQLR
jgi:protein TonB